MAVTAERVKKKVGALGHVWQQTGRDSDAAAIIIAQEQQVLPTMLKGLVHCLPSIGLWSPLFCTSSHSESKPTAALPRPFRSESIQ